MQAKQTTNDSEARMTRGLQILEGKQIVENEDGSFAVPSQTSKNIYEVRLLGQACQAITYRACSEDRSIEDSMKSYQPLLNTLSRHYLD